MLAGGVRSESGVSETSSSTDLASRIKALVGGREKISESTSVPATDDPFCDPEKDELGDDGAEARILAMLGCV